MDSMLDIYVRGTIKLQLTASMVKAVTGEFISNLLFFKCPPINSHPWAKNIRMQKTQRGDKLSVQIPGMCGGGVATEKIGGCVRLNQLKYLF